MAAQMTFEMMGEILLEMTLEMVFEMRAMAKQAETMQKRQRMQKGISDRPLRKKWVLMGI